MPNELLDELRQEHRSVAMVLNCLDRQVRILESGGHPELDIIVAVLDYFEGFPDQHHHPKEDLLLARLRQRDRAEADRIGDLEQAHRELSNNLHAFALAVRAALQDSDLHRDSFVSLARSFIDLQRGHLAMEEARFFPAVERMLTPDDWVELAASIPEYLDSSRGSGAKWKYESLRRDILEWDAEDFSGG